MFRANQKQPQSSWSRQWTPVGVVLRRESVLVTQGAIPLTEGHATQLSDDGYLVESDGSYVLSWDALYEATRTPAYAELPTLLGLPPFTEMQMVLRSRNALTDQNFSIAIAGWQERGKPATVLEHLGGVLSRGS